MVFANPQGPQALIVRPGSRMNEFLRPHVPAPLRSATVDLDAALREYEQYRDVFRANGVSVHEAHLAAPALEQRLALEPDSVFPEDAGTFLPTDEFPEGELYLEAAMTPESRQGEPGLCTQVLLDAGLLNRRQIVRLTDIDPDARLEIGDRLEIRRGNKIHLVIGLSERTNEAGFRAMEEINRRFGFGTLYRGRVHKNCLHLTSGSNLLSCNAVLADPQLVDIDVFRSVPDLDLILVPQSERGVLNNANCVPFPVTGTVAMDSASPKTIEHVRRSGFTVAPLDNSNHRIGAGGLSCRSLRWNWHAC